MGTNAISIVGFSEAYITAMCQAWWRNPVSGVSCTHANKAFTALDGTYLLYQLLRPFLLRTLLVLTHPPKSLTQKPIPTVLS